MTPVTIKDFPARLEAFLSQKLGRPVTVAALRQLTGGASRDAWVADVCVEGAARAVVVRRDKGGEIMPDALDRAAEFDVLQRAHQAGVLVPRPLWLCMDAAVLGAPFFIMERLEGESVGRRVVRDPLLAAARQKLPRQMGEQLAKIHSIPTQGLALPGPLPGKSPWTSTGRAHSGARADSQRIASSSAGCGSPNDASSSSA